MSDLPRLKAEHGVVCRLADEPLGYFAWPSAARLGDGRIVAVCSGLRAGHIGPFGKTVMLTSDDDGASWSAPRVTQNSLIDDRDAGVLCLGGQRLVVTWFRSDTRIYEAGRDISDAWRAETDGYVETILGRRRTIPDIGASNAQVRAQAERLAINSVVQGSAADLIKQAMVHVARRIAKQDRPERMLLQIHDELVLEVPAGDESAQAMLVEEMTGAIELAVPLKVDVGRGPSWLEA